MIRALAIVLLLAGFVHAPAGWREDVEQANALAAKANQVSQFGGAPAVATAQVFLPAEGPGALYVTAIAGKVKDHRDEAARVAVDSFLGAPKRAQLVSPTIGITQSASGIEAATKQIVASLQWRDADAQTETHARLVIAGDADHLVAITGECVFGAATPPQARDACDQALATLAPGIAADKRVALALAPQGTEPPAPDAPRAPSMSPPPPTMSDGPRAPLPPITIATEPQRTTDRRPVYVGLGIVVLAALFWWNRRRRERFDAKDDVSNER